MRSRTWNTLQLGAGPDNSAWELFHENSKMGRYEDFPPSAQVVQRMQQLAESLEFRQRPAVALPSPPTLVDASLGDTIANRVTARRIEPCSLSLQDLAGILYYGYGITRDNSGSDLPRAFRTVPSAGALYPLELFFYTAHVRDLDPGLYHYSSRQNNVRLLRRGHEQDRISESLVQANVALDSALVLFITAIFERCTFKYGDRGYRFTLLEAGHVAQNVNLVSVALGLAAVNIGGFFDREVDTLLGLDGLNHSTLYIVGIGKTPAAPAYDTETR